MQKAAAIAIRKTLRGGANTVAVLLFIKLAQFSGPDHLIYEKSAENLHGGHAVADAQLE